MAATINANYSQFYKGTEQIHTSGSGKAQKDTLVHYEINTKDDQGNKVMDRMYKEETMQAANAISSQYGSNVIVEISGDGLAALTADRKPLKDVPTTPREPAEVSFLDGPAPLTDEELAKINERHGDDTEAMMRVYDPKAYEEMMKIREEGATSGTREGLVAGMRYMINYVTEKAKTDPGWVDKANKMLEKESDEEKERESKLSDKAKSFLDSLRKKYRHYDFLISDDGQDKDALMKQSRKQLAAVFSVSEMERMSSDDRYANDMISAMMKR